MKIFFMNRNTPNEILTSISDNLFFFANLDKHNNLSFKEKTFNFNLRYNLISEFHSSPLSFFNKYFNSFNKALFKYYKPYSYIITKLPPIRKKVTTKGTNTPMFEARNSILGNSNLSMKIRNLFTFNKTSQPESNATKNNLSNYIDQTQDSSPFSLDNLTSNKTLSFYNIFDINYLKRERLYTKLKYSRSPAYDIVSGGAAAFLAGFIGFLVSEKFGIELVDSGDFYIAFMYGVFLALAFKPLMRILQNSNNLLLNFLNQVKLTTMRAFTFLKSIVLYSYSPNNFLSTFIIKLPTKLVCLYYLTLFLPMFL